jgi:hypothetical protein
VNVLAGERFGERGLLSRSLRLLTNLPEKKLFVKLHKLEAPLCKGRLQSYIRYKNIAILVAKAYFRLPCVKGAVALATEGLFFEQFMRRNVIFNCRGDHWSPA